MQRFEQGQILFSPTDLVTFLGCRHSTFLDYHALFEKMETTEESASNRLLQKRGIEHEFWYLQQLKDEKENVIEIPKDLPLQKRVDLTKKALESGADAVYQGVLFCDPWRGDADFLIRCDSPSALGPYSYEVADTKLAHTAEPKHIIQICMYSELLTALQGLRPSHMHLVLGTKNTESYKVDEFFSYYRHAKKRFEKYMRTLSDTSSAEPCSHCGSCRWKNRCEKEWEEQDHLSLIANIQRTQEAKLREEGIFTVKDLAEASPDNHIRGLSDETYLRLQSQASLQHEKKTTGKDLYTLLPPVEGKGFDRLPHPDNGDLFFDMEGDPLYPGGLEYLFGLHTYIDGHPEFIPFWAHNPRQEKETFIEFMEYLKQHLSRYPASHIYHYNHYETTALKRLACRYAAEEEFLDNMLRNHTFVDLYVVVREGIRTSQPGYSIKNLEVFYMDKRENTVATATDSIVVYNEWRETGEDILLQEIADYNEVDCVSTRLLRNWLVSIRPDSTTWFDDTNSTESPVDVERKDWEIEYESYRKKLGEDDENVLPICQRVSHLLEFHNREAKPQWWNQFSRQMKSEEELIDDIECIGSCELTGEPYQEKRSLVYTYSFPPQEFKLKAGDTPVLVLDMQSGGTIIEIDENSCTLKIKRGISKPLPNRISLGPNNPIRTSVMRNALYHYADQLINEKEHTCAATEILERNFPRIKGRHQTEPVITFSDTIEAAKDAVSNLDRSYLFIQGPPGTGKTYASAHIIVHLLQNGKKVGISSNSHKAVHNLLSQVDSVAAEKQFRFRGIKKATRNNEDTMYRSSCIESVYKTADIDFGSDLYAGTAWTFSDALFYGKLDYLFIDEAGQVSTANVIAMAESARSIVLVGDQMQLGQPIQGVHPGEAGQSVLEFLLDGRAVISQERGIFLSQTRRMHPDICTFISDLFYEGKLKAHPDTSLRTIDLKGTGLPDTGVAVIPAEHDGCSQKSEEEGAIILSTYKNLLGRKFSDENGVSRPLTSADILIVTPYNVQVNYLKSILPDDAQVGTVDKFQGQQAPVVLVSMVTSSGEYMPRNIEFLYSGNRLNVAISRAQCLAVVVMNLQLLEISCTTTDQMKLVNTFCRLNEYAHGMK